MTLLIASVKSLYKTRTYIDGRISFNYQRFYAITFVVFKINYCFNFSIAKEIFSSSINIIFYFSFFSFFFKQFNESISVSL